MWNGIIWNGLDIWKRNGPNGTKWSFRAIWAKCISKDHFEWKWPKWKEMKWNYLKFVFRWESFEMEMAQMEENGPKKHFCGSLLRICMYEVFLEWRIEPPFLFFFGSIFLLTILSSCFVNATLLIWERILNFGILHKCLIFVSKVSSLASEPSDNW